ncbi:ubiquitin carboxyl-terminal hydrolase 19-like isoform X1 [Octopus vulgaris]|uniref:ubiquitinyl hydrolase 1 n=1 Tax=Octopus vulgaris TaxID=6645 RepID=A0AA36FL75_OCTVU|nr:ubiquitin carboxyl-terminal hydrolase 19-like isoform X1 [Octopus vulgaris]
MATGSSISSSSGSSGGDDVGSGGGGGGHGHHHHHYHHHHHQQQQHHQHYQQPDGQVAGTTMMMMEEAEVAAAAASPLQHGITDSTSPLSSTTAAALVREGGSSSSNAVAATTIAPATSLTNNTSSSSIITTVTTTTTTVPTLPVTHGLLPPSPSSTAVAAAAALLPPPHTSPPTESLPSLAPTPSSPATAAAAATSRTLLPPLPLSSTSSSTSTSSSYSSSRVTIAAPSGTATSSRIELTTASSLSLAKRKKEMDSSRDGSGLLYKRLKYDWNQTDDHVTITVKLGDEAEFSDPEFSQTGVKMKLRDGTVWGLTFNSEIDSNNCKMELADSSTSMVLTVRKKVHSHWTSLEADISDDHNQAADSMDNVMTDNVLEQLVSNENDNSWNDSGTEMHPLESSCYQLQHTKHDWIEKNETFIIHIYVRKTNVDGVKVFFKQRLVAVRFQTSDPKFLDLHQGTTESTVFCWKINVKHEILPLACKYRVTGSLIEVTLSKKEPLKWGALEVPLQKRNIIGNRSSEWLPAAKDRPVPHTQQTGNSTAATVVTTATGTTFSTSRSTMNTANYSSSSSATITGYPPPPPPPPAPPLPALPTAAAAAMSPTSHYGTSSTAVDSSQRGGSGDGMPLDELQELAATPGTIGDRRGIPTCDNFSPSNPCNKPTLPMVNQKPTCKVSPMNKLRDIDQLVTPGFTGLDNLGNSCFMNSVLQCLANTSEFRDYFLDGSFQKEINTENLLGSGGQLASAFAVLLRCLWSGKYTSYQPSKLKNLVAMKASVFTGFAQHDAQEFMAFLLDMLHEDLNRVKNKPYIQTVDSDGRPDEIVANEAWDVYKKRDDSFIVDLFQGQYKSKLVCPVCEKVSITFDPFCYLSIPLPKKQRLITVVFFWKEPYRKPVQYKLRMTKDATVELLKDKLSKKTSVKARNIRVFESKRSKIHKIYGRGTLLSSDYSTERLIASEVLSQEMAGEPVYEIYIIQRIRMPMFSSTMCSSCKKKSPEGRPLKRCTRCYKVGYCNQECQRAHWEIHKESCKCNPIGCPFLISLPKSRATFSRLRKLLEAYSRYSVNVFQPPVKAEVSSSSSAAAASMAAAASTAAATTTILTTSNTTTATKLPSSITTGCSMSGLSSSSQSSGSLSSLDSQASYSSACTLTADPETNMADVHDDDDDDADGNDGNNGGDDGHGGDAMTSTTTTTGSGLYRNEGEEEADEDDICSGGGDGRRKRSNTTGSVMSSERLRAGLPARFSPIPTPPSNSSVTPPHTSLSKCAPLPTVPSSLLTTANSTPPLPPPPPPLPPAAISPTMPALTPSGDPSPLPLMPFSRTEADTMLDVEQWQRTSLLSSSSSSPSLPSTSPPAPCLSSSSTTNNTAISPAHQSPATTPTGATSAGGGDASLLLSDRMHLSRTQLPTSAVLGLQNEETPLDQGPALFFVKPVCQDGSEINGYNGMKLEDRGDEALDLKNKKFLAMDWQNNDRQPRFVLVQSKELECDDDETVQLESLDDTGDISLDHCLNLFTEPEVLSQEEAWYCPQCAEHREATKQMSIWRLPRMLIIQLKRFSYGHLSWRDKVDKMVHFPTRGLDMSCYFIGNRPDSQTSTIYDLYGVINHTGGLLGGHYTSYVRCADKFTPFKNEVDWRFCDDSHVVPVVEKNVVTRLAYLLFYRRHDAPPMSESELAGIMSDAVSSAASGVIGGCPLNKTNATPSTALTTATNTKTVPEGPCSAMKTEEMPELQLSTDVSERKLAVGNATLNWSHSATSDVIVDDDSFPPPLDNRYNCTSLPYTDMDAVD